MLEILVAIAVIVAAVKIANADDQSPLMWGLAAFGTCAASIALIPLPFLRLGIAGIAVFIGMIVVKVLKG